MLRIERYIGEFAKKYGFEFVGVPLAGAAMVFVGSMLLALNPFTAKFAERLSLFPPWPLAIVLGVAFCLVKNRNALSLAAPFAWALPAAYVLMCIISIPFSVYPAYEWQDWRDMFTYSCPGEGCFGPIMACVPLVFSLSYSATAVILWSRRRANLSKRHRLIG